MPALGSYRIAGRDEAVKRTNALLAERGVKFGVPSTVGPGAQVSQHLGGAASSFGPLMTHTTSGDLDRLRSAIRGTVLGPHDEGYDAARKVWNADIDCRPAAIAQCKDAADVAAAITFATQRELEIAVRAGAHSTAGVSAVDDGLVIHLGQMNHVAVEPATKRARVGGGALLRDLDAATQAHGLAVPAGLISHTGVAGLTLGGGMGWLTRQAGLSIDNLESAEIVTADGQILRAAENENPDLFWAIRGGGGNFGVVTEFEFRLHEVGPVVQFGLLFWDLGQGTTVLRLARDVVATLPRELNIVIAGMNAPPAPFVPEQFRLQPGYAMLVTGFGASQTHKMSWHGFGAPSHRFSSSSPRCPTSTFSNSSTKATRGVSTATTRVATSTTCPTT